MAIKNVGLKKIHEIVQSLNNSKFFAGIVMIIMNIGSQFISIKFSKSMNEYLRYGITKQVLIFSVSWVACRDIYTSLSLTAIFTILSEHLFNEESRLCVVPKKYRILDNILDTNEDGKVDENEIKRAIEILQQAQQRQKK
jgi:hypothetical protein